MNDDRRGLYGDVPSNRSRNSANYRRSTGAHPTSDQLLRVSNATKSPGLAIASLVLGIGASCFAFIPVVGFLSVPFALVGLALGIAGFNRARHGFEGKGLATVGIATSLLALAISVAWVSVFSDASQKLSARSPVPPPTTAPASYALSQVRCDGNVAMPNYMRATYIGSFTNRSIDRRDFALTVRFRSTDGATSTGQFVTGPLSPGETVPVKAEATLNTSALPLACTIDEARLQPH